MGQLLFWKPFFGNHGQSQNSIILVCSSKQVFLKLDNIIIFIFKFRSMICAKREIAPFNWIGAHKKVKF